MSVYMLAAINVRDEAGYQPYVQQAIGSLQAHGVEVLAVTNEPRTHEGNNPWSRYVLLKFADQAAFDAWYTSPEYKAAKPIRQATAETGFIITLDGVA